MKKVISNVSVARVCGKWCLLGILSAFSAASMAASLETGQAGVSGEIQDERKAPRHTALQGILGSKALLLVDGERLMLSVGQPVKSGVRVLRIGAELVEISIDGERRQLRLGDSHSVFLPLVLK